MPSNNDLHNNTEDSSKGTSSSSASVQQERMAALGELSGQVAHEINNLVSLMLAYTQSARASGSEDKVKRALDTVIDVSAKLLHLSGSIIDFLKGVPSRFSYASPVEALQEILELMNPTLQKARISVQKDFQTNIKVSCDISQLQQVFINVINNARDALKDIENPRIDVSSREDDKYMYIEIKDNGCGMTETVKNKVFEPFFTTKKGDTKNVGIGLSVSRDIVVKRHLGKFRCDSTQNEGTAFTIVLHKDLNLQPKAFQSDK